MFTYLTQPNLAYPPKLSQDTFSVTDSQLSIP